MTRAGRVCTAAAAALVAAVVAPPASAPASGGARSVIATAASARALPAGARFAAELAPGLRAYTLRVPAGLSAEAYAQRLERREGVYAAQPNSRAKASGLAAACADPPAADKANVVAQPVNATTIAPPATTSPIAILDTGVDPTVPELAGRVRQGFNAVTGDGDSSDNDAHGTEVAAVAAASPGRFRGVSPTSPILPISIYSRSSTTSVEWVVKGIEEAVNRSSAVINISSSNPTADVEAKDADVLSQAITAALNRGAITVVAVGNEGKGNPVTPGDLPHVLTVGSVTPDGSQRDNFSNYGPWLDLVSPAANLVLPAPLGVCGTGYGSASGTSFSAPAVAGAVALIRAANPTLIPTQVFDAVRFQAVQDLFNVGRDDDSGFGMLDVGAGIAPKAPVRQATEIDDDVFWVKQSTTRSPVRLRAARSASIKSTVSVGKDPQDVYPVALKRGETLTASATSGAGGLIEVAIWAPKTGAFDIGKGRTTSLLADSDGVTNSPRSSYRASRAGTYYVSIEAPDVINTAATTDETITPAKIEDMTTYTLTLRKAKTAAKKKAKKKRARRK